MWRIKGLARVGRATAHPQHKHHVTAFLSIGWQVEGVVLFSIPVLELIQQPGCTPSALSARAFY